MHNDDWEVNRKYLQIIWNTDNVGLHSFSLNYLTSWKWLSPVSLSKAIIIWQQGFSPHSIDTFITLHQVFWLTATSHMAHQLVQLMLLSITELGVTPNFHNLTYKSCIIKSRFAYAWPAQMQYGIMLIAKYWNKLLKFHSLCWVGELLYFNLLIFEI